MSEIVIKSVDGTSFPIQPTTYKLEHEDVSKQSAGRTEDGTMHKDSIGVCSKLYLAFNGVPNGTAQTLLSLFQKTTGDVDYFTIEYFDTKTCDYRTSTFYCGNRVSECVQAFKQTYGASPVPPSGSYWNLSFDLIEKTPARW